jgi:hypothetical protein
MIRRHEDSLDLPHILFVLVTTGGILAGQMKEDDSTKSFNEDTILPSRNKENAALLEALARHARTQNPDAPAQSTAHAMFAPEIWSVLAGALHFILNLQSAETLKTLGRIAQVINPAVAPFLSLAFVGGIIWATWPIWRSAWRLLVERLGRHSRALKLLSGAGAVYRNPNSGASAYFPTAGAIAGQRDFGTIKRDLFGYSA